MLPGQSKIEVYLCIFLIFHDLMIINIKNMVKGSPKFNTDRLDKLPIEEVAGELGIKLRRNKCLCFMHEEKTPSFSINKRYNIWKCFGCGRCGGVIELVKQYNDYNFVEACQWLSNKFGMGKYLIKVPNEKKETIRVADRNKADSEVYNWFIENLSITGSVRKFIENRRYPYDITEEYKLKGLHDCTGYFEKCKSKWGIDRLLKCGLAKFELNKTTGEIKFKFTWWTDTMIIPYYDISGDVVYIQGRTLDPYFERGHKYINLTGVPTSLFNMPILTTLRKDDILVITEGVTDCISSCLMGKKAVGVIGANGFKKGYLKLLKDFDINLIPDNDASKAGEKFANRIRQQFQLVGKTITIHTLDEKYKDVSEYYRENCSMYGKIN
jgi:DNA primase